MMTEEERVASLPFSLAQNIRSILKGFKWAVHEKNTSCVIMVDGKSGLGKTTLSSQMGVYCDPDFSLAKLHYSPETFLNGGEGKIGLKQAKKGDFILFDEAMLLSNRSSMSMVNRMIIQAMSMIRSKNIIVCFCVNSLFDIDKNLAIFRADILFHVYGDSLVDRGKVMAFFKGQDGRDRLKELYLLGKKYYDYSKPKSNFFTTFTKYFPFDEKEYEYQKQKGISIFLEKASPKNKTQEKYYVSLQKAIAIILRETDMKQKDLAEELGLAVKTIYNMKQGEEDGTGNN